MSSKVTQVSLPTPEPADREKAPREAPGPIGDDLARRIALYDEDPLEQSLSLFQDFGDIVALRRGPFVTIFLFHPSHTRHVLVTHNDQYSRRTTAANQLKSAIGDGLVTADKPDWTRQKKLTQPGFTKKVLDGWIPKINRIARALCDEWHQRGVKTPIDVHPDFGRALLQVIGEMLFGDAFSAEQGVHVRRALEATADLERAIPRQDLLSRDASGASDETTRIYRERFREFMETQSELDRLLDAHVAKRRKEASQEDLLSAWIGARDEEGKGFTDAEVRNQLKTMVAAGHDTTMSALSLTLFALAQSPAVLEKVRREVEEVCEAREATAEDLERLPYMDAVISESLRLYPPVAHIDRRAEVEDVIDGVRIPKGAAVALSPFVVQRRGDLWENPLEFNPDRFIGRTPSGYFPFSVGQRTCLGRGLALMELKIFLTEIVRRFDVLPVDGFELVLKSTMTVHPRGGHLPLWLHGR